jgi:hypothetical protein
MRGAGYGMPFQIADQRDPIRVWSLQEIHETKGTVA